VILKDNGVVLSSCALGNTAAFLFIQNDAVELWVKDVVLRYISIGMFDSGSGKKMKKKVRTS
jgi:hypothetical protein